MSNQTKGLTRRQILTGAGAAVTSAGVISLTGCDSVTTYNWHHETEILVVGSGVGAATAAPSSLPVFCGYRTISPCENAESKI